MRIRSLSLILLLAPACEAAQHDDGEIGSDGDRHALRTPWERVHVTNFPASVATLKIGSHNAPEDNFKNRGDVWVTYDGEPGEIEILARKFDFNADDNSFAALSLVATDAAGHDCMSGDWRDGCEILAYYDGQYQPTRTGMDIHVRLPPDFTGRVDIETEDMLAEPGYRDRGNVCITDLPGSARVQMASGNAYVTLAEDLQVVPSCDDADIAVCESGANPWALDCPCFAEGNPLGQLLIDGETSNVTVDTPADVWTAIVAENPDALDGGCEIAVTVPGAVEDPATGFFEVARPDGASGRGYGISAFSDKCAPIEYTEHPGDEPRIDEPRGHLTVCTDCQRGVACEDLVPQPMAR